MVSYTNAINTLYSIKEELLILGLTGRTGAGCSTTANILRQSLCELNLEYEQRADNKIEDELKFQIIKRYISNENHWVPFEIIEGSCVILSYIFEQTTNPQDPTSELINYLSHLQESKEGITFNIINDKELYDEIKGLKYIYNEINSHPLNELSQILEKNNPTIIDNYYETYIRKMPLYKERIKEILLKYDCYEIEKSKLQDKKPIKYHLYTYLLQKIANNIRSSGNPYNDAFNQDLFHSFAERLSLLIELIRKHNLNKAKQSNTCAKTRICIDAIRNVNESNYLKDKYRSYYLISISVDEQKRQLRLRDMDSREQASVDNVEYNGKYKTESFFYHQNIAQCFEMADIHIYNEQVTTNKNFFLTWQLVKYITLMIHPGLITPSNLERCMQLAYTLKYNSGCLSRQVGAVITDRDFSVKSVGWNDVPKGHLPCNLRDINVYCRGNQPELFSEYENEDPHFINAMNNIQASINNTKMVSRTYPYCFKDIYNGYTGEKNQVFTRALHAEENAFLQISKYGGKGIRNGFLFCTASPCELCSKKAYQLGIQNIYYIDPYPGISEKHILNSGSATTRPQMNLFYGAIGEAYISLYKPLLPYKDELELVTGLNCKKIAAEGKIEANQTPKTEDLLYHNVDFTLKFISRENIEAYRSVDFDVINGQVKELKRKITWTGSSYDGTELISETGEICDHQTNISPYQYSINFPQTKNPGDNIQYKVCTKVKDETHLMHPYLAHYIEHPTEKLTLRIIIPKDEPLLENIVYKRFADLDMKIEYPDHSSTLIVENSDSENIIYELTIQHPNLFYTYSVEWEFINIKS